MWGIPIPGAGFFLWVAAVLIVLYVLRKCLVNVGATEVALLRKRFSFKSLPDGTPVAFKGEAGYQAKLLRAGWHVVFWPVIEATKHPMVQVPPGEIGIVISQAGAALPIGAKSAEYKDAFGNFEDVAAFVAHGGQRGLQRPVLMPGTVAAIHPVGFLVITKSHVYGVPVDDEVRARMKAGKLTCQSFGLEPRQLDVLRIEPKKEDGQVIDRVGIVTTLDGAPIPKGAIASRLGDFDDIELLEKTSATTDAALVETILATKNELHNNYQDFQKFIDAGGKIGLQHDPLLYGAYALNPYLVAVELVPMLVVQQGEVGVVKAYVGRATEDTSGADFKFGSIVRPGHRGVWQESLRTGKYAINPRCYSVEIVPTKILTLNWAEAVSKAHDLDRELTPIDAKSKEGFEFTIDLQVQIHVSDVNAPRVISMVGSMANLVNELLQSAVGNHFRDKLQSMEAVKFIGERAEVQKEAEEHVRVKLLAYYVETPGVYIQNVILPDQIVEVLEDREIARQKKTTYEAQKEAQEARLEMAAAQGRADQQSDLAKSQVGITIAGNKAEAVKKAADGEAYRLTEVGRATAVKTRAEGLAIATGFQAQRKAVGRTETLIINAIRALAESRQPIMPKVLATDGGKGGGLSALATQFLSQLTGDDEELDDSELDPEGAAAVRARAAQAENPETDEVITGEPSTEDAATGEAGADKTDVGGVNEGGDKPSE